MTRSFDYGHMLTSFALGAVHALTWVAWWTRARRERDRGAESH